MKERKDVAAEARAEGREIHLGRSFGLCVEKGSELLKGHKDRKYKGRAVFLGNQVKDQNADHALFAELSSSPAALVPLWLRLRRAERGGFLLRSESCRGVPSCVLHGVVSTTAVAPHPPGRSG